MTLSENIKRFSIEAPSYKYLIATIVRAIELRATDYEAIKNLAPDPRAVLTHPVNFDELRYEEYYQPRK
jgi:hypothetical protein